MERWETCNAEMGTSAWGLTGIFEHIQDLSDNSISKGKLFRWSSYTRTSIKRKSWLFLVFPFQPKGSGEPEGRGAEAAAAAGAGKDWGDHRGQPTGIRGQNSHWLMSKKKKPSTQLLSATGAGGERERPWCNSHVTEPVDLRNKQSALKYTGGGMGQGSAENNLYEL